jgi:protein gp37
MTTEQNIGPERPSLPALKVGVPIASPSAGQIVGERRAREIKGTPVADDPRRIFREFMHILAIYVPSSTEVLDEFIVKVKRLKTEIPKSTTPLMLDILAKRIDDVRRLQRKLEELQYLLRGVEE